MYISLAVVIALQVYYVQEMIAAFVIFCILFAMATGAALLVFVVDRASKRAFAWAEFRNPRVVAYLRRGWNALEELSKRPLHRPRSETAQ